MKETDGIFASREYFWYEIISFRWSPTKFISGQQKFRPGKAFEKSYPKIIIFISLNQQRTIQAI